MQTLEIWHFLVPVFAAYSYGSTPVFQPCDIAVRGQACNMTCKTQDLAQTIDIICNGTSRGSCAPIFGCTANMYQQGLDTTYLQILSLSYVSDFCEWTCRYSSTTSQSAMPVIYSGISAIPNITSDPYPGEKSVDQVKLESTTDCIYPTNPTVTVYFRTEENPSFQLLEMLPSLDSNAVCSLQIEQRVTANILLSGDSNKNFPGKKVSFKMRFTQYPSDSPTDTDVIGPFLFPGTVTTDYTTKATTNSTSSIVNSTACSTKTTSCSTSSPTTTHVMIIVFSSVGGGSFIIIIIIIVIILWRRHKKKL